MKLNNKVYDVLKWLCLIVLPASAVCYTSIASIWGFPYASEVAGTINAISAVIGAIIGVSTVEYNRDKKD